MDTYIGLVKAKPGWIQILNQEGLYYKLFMSGDNPSVLIVDDLAKKREILDYLSEGGIIITSTELLGGLLGAKTRRIKINYIVPDSSPFFRDVGIIDIYNRGFLLNQEGYGKINSKYPAVYEFTYKKGSGVALPFDLSSVVINAKSRMKLFYTNKGRFPSESVSSVSKGALRRFVVNIIRYLFRKRGEYYIHKWYYPQDNKTAFIFRVDTDRSRFKEILYTYKIAERNRVNLTWFIDIGSLGNNVAGLREFKQNEISVHSFEHKVFRDPIKNRENFLKAKELLLKAGIKPAGVAIPYGIWNEQLGFIIEELGFSYSSEFSFSYDDLPSYPFMSKRFSKVLQIPVHPISPGAFIYVKSNLDDINHYFTQIIEDKYKKSDPIFLYGHSKVISRYPSVLEDILHLVKEKENVWCGTYNNLYRWWRKRGDTNIDFTLKGDVLTLRKENRLFLHIISPEGKEVKTPMQERIDFRKLKWEKISGGLTFDRKQLIIKKGKVKLKLKEIENWLRR